MIFKKRFLIHFRKVTAWSDETKIDVSTESLALLSPKTEQHEIFPCNGSMRYKTEWDTKVNFDLVFLLSIDIH